MKTEAKIGYVATIQGMLGPPEAGTGEQGFSSGAFRGSTAYQHLNFRFFVFQNRERANFCYLKLLSTGRFVMAALGN